MSIDRGGSLLGIVWRLYNSKVIVPEPGPTRQARRNAYGTATERTA